MKKTPKLKVDKFDIILITHNRLELTIRAISALYGATACPFHLIIVDDSTDLTPQYVKEFQKTHDNVSFIHSDEPYREGNQIFNIGFKNATCAFVAIIMNSITVEPDWERVGLQFLFEHPEVGMVGLKCLKPWGPIESAGIAMQGHIPIDLGADHPSHRLTNLYEREAVQWALAIVRKKAVTGNIAEGIYHGFKGTDDIDNCFVLRKAGWKIYYCGYGCGYHETRATRASNKAEDIKLNRENQEIFYKRWGYWEKYQEAGGEKSIMPARVWTE